jgi:hypothetical protein
MTIRFVTTTLIALAVSAPAFAQTLQDPALKHRLPGSWLDQQSAQQTKPEAKPDAKPAAGSAAALAGKWDVDIQNPSGAMQAMFELKADDKDPKKVTGMISSQVGEAQLVGQVVDGKLSFKFTMNANGQDLPVAFDGTLQKDGSLAGTLEYGQGPVNWTATRQKK